jgi:hypothetical protein
LSFESAARHADELGQLTDTKVLLPSILVTFDHDPFW